MAALVAVNGELTHEEAFAYASRKSDDIDAFDDGNTLIAFVDRFRKKLGDLDEEGVRQQFSDQERRFVADPDAQMRITVAAAAQRQADIEEKADYKLGKQALALTQMVVNSEPFRPSKGFDLDPSSIP